MISTGWQWCSQRNSAACLWQSQWPLGTHSSCIHAPEQTRQWAKEQAHERRVTSTVNKSARLGLTVTSVDGTTSSQAPSSSRAASRMTPGLLTIPLPSPSPMSPLLAPPVDSRGIFSHSIKRKGQTAPRTACSCSKCNTKWLCKARRRSGDIGQFVSQILWSVAWSGCLRNGSLELREALGKGGSRRFRSRCCSQSKSSSLVFCTWKSLPTISEALDMCPEHFQTVLWRGTQWRFS